MQSTLPPGLDVTEELEKISEGGSSLWLDFESVRLYTNAFIRQDEKLLLGYKKRGFGKDLFNGFGGKVDVGETPLEAAIRELEEEAGITAPLEHCGTLFFTSTDSKEAAYIEVFYAEQFSGTEMRPQWFAISSAKEQGLDPIPFDKMWEDDRLWMRLLLGGCHFVGRVDFGPDAHLQKWWFGVRPRSS
ncbi:uncharacterized protein LAESUDRAFT_689577 [Laetiporus sulphureus 93-53]|uniref:Oxidized purine nucleoside triphosphate hydrolase n=1 Tax=Laetiporus sulphureus 93-53 TaxID=1314785 RepID=A0A165I9I6_9APHY|nr:uncharacterized protein LAESUDRAFT_689577 [Laetiporus sulphureus 93-53]KZT12768.1 hypothetical protein LAESUDRAFT_689577 [Laetiporus sulphureus 93-53]